MGRAIAEVLRVFAALESRTIGDCLRSTIAYRVGRDDRWRGGPAPCIYKPVPHPSGDEKTPLVEPAGAAFVRQAADMVVAGGTLYKAMQTLTAGGSRPRRAKRGPLSSLRVVLTGDSALGRQSTHGAPLRDEDGLFATRTSSSRRPGNPSSPSTTSSGCERCSRRGP